MITLFILISAFLAIPKMVHSQMRKTPKGNFAHVPASLNQPVQILLRCPPVRELLAKIEKEGPIGLSFSPLGENAANAMWRDDIRQIIINSSKRRGIPQFIRSILFEMHNAASRSHLYQVDLKARKAEITKEDYVRAIEKLEHQNALQTKELINWGIKEGYFPPESAWNILTDFEDHYKVQQLSGHSQFIATVYDSLNSRGKAQTFRGTIAMAHLSSQDKEEMLHLLSIKDKLEYGSILDKQKAKSLLEVAYAKNNTQELALLNKIFGPSNKPFA